MFPNLNFNQFKIHQQILARQTAFTRVSKFSWLRRVFPVFCKQWTIYEWVCTIRGSLVALSNDNSMIIKQNKSTLELNLSAIRSRRKALAMVCNHVDVDNKRCYVSQP